MATDFGQIPRQNKAYNDQEQLIKSGAIKAGPIGSPFSRVALPTVKRVSPPITRVPSMVSGAVNAVKNFKFPQLGSPFVSAAPPHPILAMLPKEPLVSEKQKLVNAIQQGYGHWGQNLPAAQYANEMADLTMQYPLYQKHPFMIPALTINETGGGTKVKYPNNFVNWGIHEPSFQPQTPLESILKAASGIAERSKYYEPFRKSGNLLDFANTYAPLSSNPQTGGPYYAKNLQSIMDVFNSFMK